MKDEVVFSRDCLGRVPLLDEEASSSWRKSSSKSMSRVGSSVRLRADGSVVQRRRGLRGEEPADLLMEERGDVGDEVRSIVMRSREGAGMVSRGGEGVVVIVVVDVGGDDRLGAIVLSP